MDTTKAQIDLSVELVPNTSSRQKKKKGLRDVTRFAKVSGKVGKRRGALLPHDVVQMSSCLPLQPHRPHVATRGQARFHLLQDALALLHERADVDACAYLGPG